jgi:hypothetical protein
MVMLLSCYTSGNDITTHPSSTIRDVVHILSCCDHVLFHV